MSPFNMPAAPERLPHLQKMVEHLRDAQEPLRHLQQLVEMARDAPSPVVTPTPLGVTGDMILGTLMLVIALRLLAYFLFLGSQKAPARKSPVLPLTSTADVPS